MPVYTERMTPRSRRVTALLANILLAHTMWVGSGFACAPPGTGRPAEAAADATGTDMAGMDMPGRSQANESKVPAEQIPCSVPWAPDNCRDMVLCAPPACAAPGQVVSAPPGIPGTVAPRAILTPTSPTIAPEPPPPKA